MWGNTKGKSLLIVLFFLCAIVISGCSKSGVRTAPSWGNQALTKTMAMESESRARPMRKSRQMRESIPATQIARPDQIKPAHELKPQKRMIYYNGHARIRVVKPEKALDKATEIAIASGGYVEKRRNNSITLRVPVKNFHTIFNNVIKLGVILKKSISAEDITDEFADMALRLNIAQKSLKRYMELLAKAKDEEEKILLLKEITRLNEKIEYMQNAVKTLALLAGFSRITLEAMPFSKVEKYSVKKDINEFNWINSLTPFSSEIAESQGKLKFSVPDKMVLLGGDLWKTESADGTVFWSHKRKNDPSGNTDFWINAVKVRFEKDFASAEIKTIGTYKYIRLVSFADQPYVYYIGVMADKMELFVFEVFFPDKNQEKIYMGNILEALKANNSND